MTIKHLYPTATPSLNLDFANSKKLDPRIEFERLSIGTYVGANGLIEYAVAGEARFDHDKDGNSLGLLVEESRANSLRYSQDFTNALWTKTDATIIPNSVIAPDGTLTGSTMKADAGTAILPSVIQNAGDAAIRTLSLYAKMGTYRYLKINPRLNGYGLVVDLQDGSVYDTGPTNVVSADIVPAPNGWYRLILTTSMTSATRIFAIRFSTEGGGSTTFDFDGTETVHIWGAQLETGDFPTSYIPTTSSAVTRAADVVDLTSTGIYDTDSFTILNEPYGSAGGSTTLNIVGAGQTPVKRTTVYSQNLSQTQINTLVKKTDEFWRWRILGSSFALLNFTTDGQVTVDWGDGTVETLTTSEHTFSNGSGYHDIGFRLDSGTYFRPYINNATHRNKVVAIGPAPESMKLDGFRAFFGCNNLEIFDATVDVVGGFYEAWNSCTSLISFPWIDTSSVTSFFSAWLGCSSLTSFPLIDTSSGTTFQNAWVSCSSLTSFPLIDTSSGTNFQSAWQGCSSLTSFPLIDTSSGTNFYAAWYQCASLTSFPAIDTSIGTRFGQAWRFCSSLTNFPANFFDSWTGTPVDDCFVNAWDGCSSLTATSVENILNSIDTSGQSAPASGVDITIDYNASSGTPNISTAVTNLKSRGWTITLNGVAQ
jgi:hypothetical protein